MNDYRCARILESLKHVPSDNILNALISVSSASGLTTVSQTDNRMVQHDATLNTSETIATRVPFVV